MTKAPTKTDPFPKPVVSQTTVPFKNVAGIRAFENVSELIFTDDSKGAGHNISGNTQGNIYITANYVQSASSTCVDSVELEYKLFGKTVLENVNGKDTVIVGGNHTFKSESTHELNVDGAHSINVGIDQHTCTGGDQSIKVKKGDRVVDVGVDLIETIGGNVTREIYGGWTGKCNDEWKGSILGSFFEYKLTTEISTTASMKINLNLAAEATVTIAAKKTNVLGAHAEQFFGYKNCVSLGPYSKIEMPLAIASSAKHETRNATIIKKVSGIKMYLDGLNKNNAAISRAITDLGLRG